MPDQFDYRETVASRSPSSAGFSMDGGRSVRTHYVTSTNLYGMIREILGTSKPHQDGSRIRRILPKADPHFPWLHASSISNIIGVGGPASQTAADPGRILECEPFDDVAIYPGYMLTVEFTPRPYKVATDDELTSESITNIPNTGEAGTDYTVYDEWRRYTDIEHFPKSEYITAQQGQFIIDVASAVDPDGRGMGQGIVKMIERKVDLKVTWYQVPYSFVLASDAYIWQGLGCVNQSAFLGKSAGTLLYTALRIAKRYTPPVPEREALEFSPTSGKVIYASQKLCDLEFLFEFMDPPLGKDTAGNTATPRGGPNLAVIPAGHNLRPNGPLQSYFYVKTANQSVASLNDQPIYPSYNLQLLFKQPTV